MAFREAAIRQELDILQPTVNEITSLDTDHQSDDHVSISSDKEMESPVESESKQSKKNDVDQPT